MEETNLRRDRWTALGLFVGFLTLYLATLCPTVYFGDSGEIGTAIFTGGVIHPPGYPLFSLLGRAALVLVPMGEPAFRIGCVVVLAAAGAIATLFLVLRQLRIASVAAAAAAGLFGGSYLFWNQSIRVEVYSLHLLLIAGAFLFTLRWRESKAIRDLLLACLCVSLGLAHHLTIVLMLPALLVLAGRELWILPGLGKRLGACLSTFLIGPGLYGFLPLWASRETGHNWGDPRSAAALWNHMSARLYQGMVRLPKGIEVKKSLQMAAEFSAQGLPTLLWPVAALGFYLFWKRDRGAALGFLVAVLTVFCYNLCYRIPDIGAYYLPMVLALISFVGVAFGALSEKVSRPSLGLALIAAPLALISINLPTCNLRNATFVRELARQKLMSCDPESVLIVAGDQDFFPVTYVHETLGVRPDVLSVDWGMLQQSFLYRWDSSRWYPRSLRSQGFVAPIPIPKNDADQLRLARDGYLVDLLDGPLSKRPLCITFLDKRGEDGKELFAETGLRQWISAKTNPAPQGLVIALHPKAAQLSNLHLAERNQQIWDRLALPDLDSLDTSQEMDPDYLTRHYVSMLANDGFLWERAGKPENAAAIYGTLLEWAPEQAAQTLSKMSPLAAEAVKRTQVAANR